MSETRKNARIAGLLYLLMVFGGVFTLMYVPGILGAKGTAAETAENILAHQSLVRIDLATSFLTSVLFVCVALVLYRLLKNINPHYAALMAILVIIQTPQMFVSQLLEYGSLQLASGAGILSMIDAPQRDALVVLCQHMNSSCSTLSAWLWGLWLFPLGWLIFHSGFLPRFLGVWLIINGFAYVAQFIIGIFLPDFLNTFLTFAFPAMLGEAVLTVWLLFLGFRPLQLAPASAAA